MENSNADPWSLRRILELTIKYWPSSVLLVVVLHFVWTANELEAIDMRLNMIHKEFTAENPRTNSTQPIVINNYVMNRRDSEGVIGIGEDDLVPSRLGLEPKDADLSCSRCGMALKKGWKKCPNLENHAHP